jgi:hypothetical protein
MVQDADRRPAPANTMPASPAPETGRYVETTYQTIIGQITVVQILTLTPD